MLVVASMVLTTARAQNPPAVVAEGAKNVLAQQDKFDGLYGNRCSLGVFPNSGLYVARTILADSKFRPGDRIVRINGVSVEGSPPSYFAALGRIEPAAIARVQVVRAGAVVDLDVQCTNAAPYTESFRRALSAAAGKNWAGCVDALRDASRAVNGRQHSFLAGLWLDCGFNSGLIRQPEVPTFAYEEWRLLIEEDKWDPEAWPSTKGRILAVLPAFERAGQSRLAAELQSQMDAVDRAREAAPESTASQPENAHPAGSGTGFLVNSSGAVATSAHVVSGNTPITVRCGRREPVQAKVLASSATTDVAILSTGLKATPYLSMSKPRSAKVGQRVFTYGYPVTQLLGAEPKFTDGTISSLSGIGGEQTYLQMSVPVQPGNSGGPVVSETGEVIGIVAAAAAIAPFLKSTGTLPQSVNWAVKSEYAALLFDAPPAQPPAASRDDAIARVERSLCFIEVQ